MQSSEQFGNVGSQVEVPAPKKWPLVMRVSCTPAQFDDTPLRSQCQSHLLECPSGPAHPPPLHQPPAKARRADCASATSLAAVDAVARVPPGSTSLTTNSLLPRRFVGGVPAAATSIPCKPSLKPMVGVSMKNVWSVVLLMSGDCCQPVPTCPN